MLVFTDNTKLSLRPHSTVSSNALSRGKRNRFGMLVRQIPIYLRTSKLSFIQTLESVVNRYNRYAVRVTKNADKRDI